MKRFLVILISLMLCTGLFSCKENLVPVLDKNGNSCVVSYDDTGIDRDFFYANLASYKYNYIYYYLGLDGDYPDVWNMESEEKGVTIGDAVKKLSVDECCVIAWVLDWAHDNGVALSEEDKTLIDRDISALVEQMGGEEKYLEFIGKMGYTDEDMRRNSETSLLYERAMEKLCAKGGLYEIPEKEVQKYFDENYVAVKHIYVNTAAEIDEGSGEYVAISEETKTQKEEKISRIESALNENEENFDLLYSMSDDNVISTYPDGIILTRGDVYSSEYEKACFELEMGELVRVDIADIGTYFIKRVEYPEDQLDTRLEEARVLVRGNVQEKILEEYRDKFVIDEEYVKSFDLASVSIG